jgi:glycerol-3-phosphate dehydrogenase (NAD(P)+)
VHARVVARPPSRVCVLGAGSWGTTVAVLATAKAPTVLWARRAELAEAIRSTGRNPAYLGDRVLPSSLEATSVLAEALEGSELVFMAVPSHGFRSILNEARAFMGSSVPVVSLAKGLEDGTLLRMTELVHQLDPSRPVALLTGPNLASEVADGQPTASVVAARSSSLATQVQWLLHSRTFRVYTNDDVVGCEIAGCLKNVIAIAAGMAEGLGFGDNTRAALLTRGLFEMGRIGVALGGHPLTFAGLAGMGDLIATCTSPRSRNHYVGVQLGRGRSLASILDEMSMVAEGVKTAAVAVELGNRHGVPMPISAEVARVLAGEATPAQAVEALLERAAGDEMEGIR